MADEQVWETPFPFPHLDIHSSVHFVSAAEVRVQATKGFINLQSGTEDGIIHLVAEGTVKLQSKKAAIDISTRAEDGHVNLLASGSAGLIHLSSTGDVAGSGMLVGPSGIEMYTGVAANQADILMKPGELRLSIGPPGLGTSVTLTTESIALKVGGAIVLELASGTGIKASVGENSFQANLEGISERVGVIERTLNNLGHKLQAAESTWQLTPAGTKVNVPLQESNLEAANKEETLLASLKQVLRKFKGLWMGGT